MLPDSLAMAAHFARTRWQLDFRDRDRLAAWQQARLARFLREVLPRAPRYQGLAPADLSELPVMDKAAMMADFQSYNTRGVRLEDAFDIALKAETTRDFAPMLGELTVGLSSGTSGNRGVFLVSPGERVRWAGILLARALPQPLLGRLLTPWQPPLRIAFFLRANSNLYTTLNSRRIDFAFHDLLAGVAPAVPALNASQPDVLVGPPSLLRALCAEVQAGRLRIRPSHVISVADVLEEGDAAAIREAFGCATHQLYQATEGFLAYSCEHGKLHLNESFMHIEPQWLDQARTRFQPVITDFTRDTQLIVRYRLNDVLRVTPQPCPCGRAERAIAAIEGRADEVLWLPAQGSTQAVAIYPDLVRRAMLFAGPVVSEFNLIQSGLQLRIELLPDGERDTAMRQVTTELDQLWHTLGVQPPTLTFADWQPPAPGAKRRRIRMAQAPQGLRCTF